MNRSGGLAAFQAGGAVTTPVDEEEDLADVIAMGGPEAVTGTEEILQQVVPETDPMVELRKMATMTKDDAMARLRTSRDTLAARRGKMEQRLEQDRWLALAQAMLSPTKTGAFGENVGYAAGALRDVNADAFERQQAIAEEEERLLHREYEISKDYFDSLANLEGFKNNSRARVVGTTTVIAPDQLDAIARNEITEAEADRNIVSIIMEPTGNTVSRVEKDENGRPWRIVDPRKVPTQAAAQEAATVTARSATSSRVDIAKQGLAAIPTIRNYRRAYHELMKLDEDTSGLNEAMRRIGQWIGISELITDNTKLADLHRMFGEQVLNDLQRLTGTKTDFEYKKIEELNAGLGKSIPENLAILDRSLTRAGELIDRGEFAAQSLGKGPGTEEKGYWLEEYARFREEQAGWAALAEDELDTTRTPPEGASNHLMQLMQEAQGNPDQQKIILDQFRQNFDIPPDMVVPLRRLGAPL